jgi:glutathione S-transferase/glutaredoxin
MEFVEALIKENTCLVFGAIDCPYTKASKELLDSIHETKTVYVDGLENGEAVKEYLASKTGQKSFPSIFISKVHIGGNSDLQLMNQSGTLLTLLNQKPQEIPLFVKEATPNAQLGEDLVLYDHLLAYFPARARLTMIEKGFPFKHVLIDIFNGQSLKPEFVEMNPNASLPVLKHGNKLITQSREICDYLNQLDKTPLGGNQVNQAHVKEWVDLIANWDGNIYMAAYTPSGAAQVLGRLNEFKIKFAEARAKEAPHLAAEYEKKIQALSSTLSEGDYFENKLELDKIMDKANQVLASQPYVCGSAYSLADVILTPIVYRVFASGQNCLKGRKNVSEWYTKMKERPSFQQTFKSAFVQKNPGLAILPAIVPALVCKLTGRC